MEEINEKVEIFICDCHSREHQIIFQYDLDDNLVYCNIHLCNHTFWVRVVQGIKHIFGYKCRYGNFDEFVWRIEDADKLIELANLLKKNNKLYNEK